MTTTLTAFYKSYEYQRHRVSTSPVHVSQRNNVEKWHSKFTAGEAEIRRRRKLTLVCLGLMNDDVLMKSLSGFDGDTSAIGPWTDTSLPLDSMYLQICMPKGTWKRQFVFFQVNTLLFHVRPGMWSLCNDLPDNLGTTGGRRKAYSVRLPQSCVYSKLWLTCESEHLMSTAHCELWHLNG